MKNVEQMKKDRAGMVKRMREITSAAEAREDRKMNQAEADEWSKLNVDVDSMAQAIDREERMQALEMSGPSPSNVQARASEKVLTKEERAHKLGQFLQAVAFSTMPGKRHMLTPELRAATGMSEGIPSDGGYFVNQDMSTELFRIAIESSTLASRCRRIPIGANSNGLKMNAIAETSRATGSRWGGVQAYWLDEAGEKTASKPKFRQMELQLKKLAALCYATDELLQDASALGSIIQQAFAEEFAWVIDNSIIRGSGAGQPLGILNSPSLVSVTKEAGQAADTIVADNIWNMWSRMIAGSRGTSAWFINQDAEPQLFSMAHVVGVGGVPVFLPANGIAGAPYSTLMGRPIIPIEQADTVGDQGDIMFLDLSQYLMIDKGGVQQAESIHVRFTYDETVYRFVTRVDGQPLWNSPLTPANSATTLSPFVVLDARA